MQSSIPSYLSELPIYKQAKVVYMLSQSLSSYLQPDLAVLLKNGLEDVSIYATGDIIQQSGGLAPQIINAELDRFSDKKFEHIASLKQLTYKLQKSCKRLENCRSNGREYIPILRKELKKFRKLQASWMLTL